MTYRINYIANCGQEDCTEWHNYTMRFNDRVEADEFIRYIKATRKVKELQLDRLEETVTVYPLYTDYNK